MRCDRPDKKGCRAGLWLPWTAKFVAATISSLGHVALLGATPDRTFEAEAESVVASVPERIERVRMRIAKDMNGAPELPKYGLAQWFNFNNFRQMPPRPFPNVGMPPGPFQNIGAPRPFQNIGVPPPPMWRNF